MSQATVNELNKLQELKVDLNRKSSQRSSTVMKIQLWTTLIGTIVAAIIAWILTNNNGAAIVLTIMVSVFVFPFLTSFGHETRWPMDKESRRAADKQDDLACELVENELQGEIIKREYGDLFGDRPQEFTIQFDDVVQEYFARVEKDTGKVWSYPKTYAAA